MNDNPAFGAGVQSFMGIPSFMRLPVSRELKGVDVAIMGVPFDSGTSYRTGARFGPRKIRETSTMPISPPSLLPIWSLSISPCLPLSNTIGA